MGTLIGKEPGFEAWHDLVGEADPSGRATTRCGRTVYVDVRDGTRLPAGGERCPACAGASKPKRGKSK